MAFGSMLMILAVLAQAEGRSVKDSGKELRQDGVHWVVPRVDPVSSSFYLSVADKAVAPRRAQVLERLASQASLLTKVLVCGTIDAVMAHFVISPFMQKYLGRQMSGGRADHAEEAASESSCTERTSPHESHLRDDHMEATRGGEKRAIAGGLAFAVLVAALAALGASKARRRRSSTRSSGLSIVVTKASSEESDLNTTVGSTPGRSSDGSRHSTDSDDESYIEEQKKKAAGAARGGRFQATGRNCRRLTDPTHCQQFGAAANVQAVQQRRQTVGGGLYEDPDCFLTVPEVRFGSDGFVRQRTAEYERRIDFQRFISETPSPEEEEEEHFRSNATERTEFYRMGTEA